MCTALTTSTQSRPALSCPVLHFYDMNPTMGQDKGEAQREYAVRTWAQSNNGRTLRKELGSIGIWSKLRRFKHAERYEQRRYAKNHPPRPTASKHVTHFLDNRLFTKLK
jgi:hypothetical protein